jgi:hypothetical protein
LGLGELDGEQQHWRQERTRCRLDNRQDLDFGMPSAALGILFHLSNPCPLLTALTMFLKFEFFQRRFLSRVIGYFRQEFFIVFKFWLVGVALSVVVSILESFSRLYCFNRFSSGAEEQIMLDNR